MIKVSEIMTSPPAVFKTELQALVYKTLGELNIPYERVDTDEVITMEDCAAVDEKLDMKMVKTLFLCSRKKTEFYLFISSLSAPRISAQPWVSPAFPLPLRSLWRQCWAQR